MRPLAPLSVASKKGETQMAAYVSTSSELFKVMKREVYAYIEGREAQAQQEGREFSRPMLGDPAIQVMIDVLKKRREGDNSAQVETVTGKVTYPVKMFLNQFLNEHFKDQAACVNFVRTPITLAKVEEKQFLVEVETVCKMSPVRRQAMMDVIRTLLPKAEGLGMKGALNAALKAGDVSQFIEFNDVLADKPTTIAPPPGE